MNIVIDSNIIFSALIRDSATRKLILEYEGVFLFPSFIFEEIEAHKQELLEKSGMGQDDFELLLALLLKKVVIVPKEALASHRKEALEITAKLDPNDAVFFACALAHPESIIWSEDKITKSSKDLDMRFLLETHKLKKQGRVRVLNTGEIAEILKTGTE